MKMTKITDEDLEEMFPSNKAPVVTPVEKDTVFIAACRLGVHCKYDGKDTAFGKPIFNEKKFAALCSQHNVIPICPEQLGGLSTPRSPCKVVQTDGCVKVLERKKWVEDVKCKDYTEKYKTGAAEAIRLMSLYNSKIYYGVNGSPMCGKGYGVLARLLESSGYEVRYW